MFPFTYVHFARMVQELQQTKGERISGFFYNRLKKTGYLDLSYHKIYFDLAHPFVSFFVISSVNVPCEFEKKDIGILGYKIVKTKHLDNDRVVYILLRKGNTYKAVSIELTGKSSYFLVIDETGKIVRKYPTFRQRKRGGDVGELYQFPVRREKPDLKKFIPVLSHIDENKLIENFCKAQTFYTDGQIVLPINFPHARVCGEYAKCMFSTYISLRFGNFGFDFVPDLPYYIYYKAASMLKNGLIKINDGRILLDGFEIQVPEKDKESIIEYLYMLGRTKRLKCSSRNKVSRDGKIGKIFSPSGYEVLVGRSAKDNNRITFNMARGNDTFFHVRDYPGAHVILKNQGQPVSEKDIKFCARLAKSHSKAKNGPVDIVFTKVKYVRPVPGIPGRIILLKENVVRL